MILPLKQSYYFLLAHKKVLKEIVYTNEKNISIYIIKLVD